MYMNQEKVATQPYVYNLLVAVWNAINSVSSGGSSNGASIKGLGGALRNLAVTSVSAELYGDNQGFTRFSLLNKDGEPVGTNTNFYATNGLHHHTVTCVSDSAGKVTITIGDVGSTPGTFNIADTTYFKTRAYSSLSVSETSYTDGKSMSATISVKNKLGDVIATPTVDIYAAGPWWDGYYEGFEAGKDSVSHSCSDIKTIPGTSIEYVTGCFGTKYL